MLEQPKVPLEVQLDWEEYYKHFSQVHGGDPVPHGEARLLFRDGWQYSNSDYAGPEYAPPEDPKELLKLKLEYWETRKHIVNNQLAEVGAIIRGLRNMAAVKSAPLQQWKIEWDEKTGEQRVVRGEVDWKLLEGRYAWLKSDLGECGRQITKLRKEQSNAHHSNAPR